MSEQITYISPTPSDSSLDGKIRWDKGRGIMRIDTPSIAVTAPDEGGLPGDIQKAVDQAQLQGGGTVFIRNGSYTEYADIVIPSSVSIVGESFGGVQIVFAGPFSLKATGSLPYSTGTVSVTSGSNVVTGSGTSWLANVTPGHKIKIGGVPYDIALVNTDTQIILRSPYSGNSASGLSYLSAIFAEKITVENLVIIGPASTPIVFNYTDLVNITNVVVPTPAGNGFSLSNSSRLVTEQLIIDGAVLSGFYSVNSDLLNCTRTLVANSGSHGFEVSNCTGLVILSCPASNNTLNGFHLSGSSKIAIISSESNENVDGLLIINSNGVQVTGGTFDRNSSDGIQLQGTSDYCTISGAQARNNTAYGVNILSGVNDTILTSCQLQSNGSGSVNNAGTTTINANNQT